MTNDTYQNGRPENTEVEKEPPELATVRSDRPQPRRLRKNVVWGVIVLLAGVALLAFSIALVREPAKISSAEDNIVPADESTLPGFVRNAPKNYGEIPVPRDFPVLGPPLEGDLGDAGLTAADPPAFVPPQPMQPVQEQLTPEQQRERDEYRDALASPVTLNLSLSTIRRQNAGGSNVAPAQSTQQADHLSALSRLSQASGRPRMMMAGGVSQEVGGHQGEKRRFLDAAQQQSGDFYIKDRLSPPVSPYELKAGSVIPCALVYGINSDLPGGITCQVRQSVYDTVTGNHLLLPQGTRAVGEYDSAVVFGQQRVLVVWHRLILPNGQSISLEGMDGVDLSGYTGYTDRVDNHWRRLVGAVVLSSLFAAAPTAVVDRGVGSLNRTVEEEIARNIGSNVQRAGDQIVSKNLNIQPTIVVRPGYAVNIFVKKDLVLAPYAENGGNYFAISGTAN